MMRTLPLVLIALAAGVAGFFLYNALAGRDAPSDDGLPSLPGKPQVAEFAPAFVLPDVSGAQRSSAEWDDTLRVVNFWATWCPPCLKEMPAFVEVQEAYGEQGFTIVAVAIDAEQDVRDFNETYGLNFPVLLGESGGLTVSRDYGNRVGALPYSALFDREGTIRFVKAGELHKETLEDELRPLL